MSPGHGFGSRGDPNLPMGWGCGPPARARLKPRLIRPGACDRFCEALATYCDNAEARHAAGLAGFEASQRYGWDEVNQELVDAYIRVIRQHDGGQQRPSPVP